MKKGVGAQRHGLQGYGAGALSASCERKGAKHPRISCSAARVVAMLRKAAEQAARGSVRLLRQRRLRPPEVSRLFDRTAHPL
jgi:hypothetical protein